MRRFGCVLLVSLVVALGAPPVAADAAYAPPVDRPVVDGFRPPLTPFGPGNRGIDYGTAPGEDVRAAGDGEVVFADQVGGTRHVVVLHADGLRTSYSFLASITVRRGDRVARGEPVGTAAGELHFGARAGDDQYLDPLVLLGGGEVDVHLVPVDQRRAGSEASERRKLLGSLVGLGGRTVDAAAAGVSWARGEVGDAVALARAEWESLLSTLDLLTYYAELPQRMLTLAHQGWLFLREQQDCTPGDVAVPPPRPGRRIAVLVGGLGSGSGRASVLDVDTGALGYAAGDVAQFSYAGGQSPGRRHLDGLPTTSYDAHDANGDIEVSAERLRAFLETVRRTHPGVPVDVIAHSQGGLVARAALGEPTDRLDPRLPTIDHLVTLGSPHHGAALATTNEALGASVLGGFGQLGLDVVTGGAVDPFSVAIGQLAASSDFIDRLDRRPLPAGTRVTSIAARGDLIAPALSSALDGATNVVVPVDGVSAHAELPGSAEAAREVGLALAGMDPTCRFVLPDLLGALVIGQVEDTLGAGLLVGGVWTSRGLPSANGRPRSPGPVGHR